ncbi:MAG: phosphatase PAP2 family protein, partial [Rhodothermales bacterium]
TRPFLVSTASAAAGLATILALNITAGPLIAAIMACTIVNTLVMTLVTRRWKISIHAAATASFVTMLLFVALTAWPSHPDASLLRPATVLSLAPLIPLMMWARVRTGAHTWGQVVAGTLYGLFVPYAELTALLQIGLFDSL